MKALKNQNTIANFVEAVLTAFQLQLPNPVADIQKVITKVITNQHFKMTTTFDTEFNAIQTLKWLPWIGDNYCTAPTANKLLFVGESHYYNPNEKGSLEKHQNNGYTRIVIEKVAIEKEYKDYKNKAAKIFPNIHFTFLGNDNTDTKSFWNKVGYYNFIQKPMNTNQGRPTKIDNINGWTNFDDLVNTVSPDTCIFLGNSAAKYFPKSFKSDTKILSMPTDNGWVNNTASKKAEIKLPSGQRVILLFIRHPSNYYSWQDWNKHLINRVPDLMNWLKA